MEILIPHVTYILAVKSSMLYKRRNSTKLCLCLAHVHPVCSISWCRNGTKLASASTDNTVSVWDVLTGECEHRLVFGSCYKNEFVKIIRIF